MATTPCWIWVGGVNGDRRLKGEVPDGGYGYVRGPDGKVLDSYLTYRELRGPVADGYLHRLR